MPLLKKFELDRLSDDNLKTAKQRRVAAALREARGDVAWAAQILGCPKSVIYDMIFRLRKNGTLPGYAPCPLTKRLESGSMRPGSLRKEIRTCSDDMREWLARNVPEGEELLAFMFSKLGSRAGAQLAMARLLALEAWLDPDFADDTVRRHLREAIDALGGVK